MQEDWSAWLVRPRPSRPPARCPTSCDDDCESTCHEEHAIPRKRSHEPADCPGKNV